MSYNGTIHVIDKTGWSKTFPLEKALTMIGSATFNDVVLSDERGNGVAAVHLQLISTQTGKRGFRMVNLVNEPLTMTLSTSRGSIEIPAKGSRNLDDGDALRLGDFKLTFYLQSAHGISLEKRSENIGLTLEMPDITLNEGKKLTGLLTVKNFGQERRCQFEVDLDGLPSDCYQIDPAPLLYPGAEEKLQIRFFHQGTRPSAGECSVQLRVSAVGAYPTEVVILPLILSVEPVYRYKADVLEELYIFAEKLPIDIPVPISPGTVNNQIGTKQQLEEEVNKSIMDEKNHIEVKEKIEEENDLSAIQPVEEMNEQEEEMDWWADRRDSHQTPINTDPLADLKRGKSKLPVTKSKVQVLKATIEDSLENEDEYTTKKS